MDNNLTSAADVCSSCGCHHYHLRLRTEV